MSTSAAEPAPLTPERLAGAPTTPATVGPTGIDAPPAPRARMLPRGIVILLALAAMWIVIAGMQQVAALIVPVFLALNLMIAVRPLGAWLEHRGMPRIVGSIAGMLTVLIALLAFFGAIAWTMVQLVSVLPQYSDRFTSLLRQGLDQLSRWGVSESQINDWVSAFNVSSLLGVLNQALSSIGAIGGLLAAAVATIVFFGLDAAGLPERMRAVERVHPRGYHALVDFSRSVRTYWLVTTAFGLIVAIIDGLALWALGVPLPGVWAVLLFVCNYIPNIGFIFAMIPPTLMALLEKGPWTAVIVVALCVGVAMLLQGLVQPRVTGRAVGLSASVSFLSVLFWSWVLGAAGALLSVPMTLLVKELFVDSDPDARWLNAFLADAAEAAVESPTQRVADEVGSAAGTVRAVEAAGGAGAGAGDGAGAGEPGGAGGAGGAAGGSPAV